MPLKTLNGWVGESYMSSRMATVTIQRTEYVQTNVGRVANAHCEFWAIPALFWIKPCMWLGGGVIVLTRVQEEFPLVRL
jgi:hypothetical protein